MNNACLMTYLWEILCCFCVVQLYDGFSIRKNTAARFWIITLGYALFLGSVLNIFGMSSITKVIAVIAVYTLFHKTQYTVNGIFDVFAAIIYYAITCNIENTVFTAAIFISEQFHISVAGTDTLLSLISYTLAILVCIAIKQQRRSCSARIEAWHWYSIPSTISLLTTILVFYYGVSYKNSEILIGPLFTSALFLAILQMAALFLVNWMEMNAHVREELIRMNTMTQSQQESLEAFSVTYAQQRKLIHDFKHHIDMLDSLLTQGATAQVKQYIHILQSHQTDNLLLVNTHNMALNALLNQKASVAIKRNVNIQFSVNDLSLLKINITDLTIIISNVLDNAIEASVKMPKPDRQIFVKALLEDDVLFLSVRNRSIPVIVVPGQLPLSTKKDASLHGYGLKNVQNTLEKYDAICAIGFDKGWFEFATELPNTLIP